MAADEPVQLVLDIAPLPALGPEDFIVADSNRAAAGWIGRWPDWPATMLAVQGPEGSGKTHLVGLWRGRSGAAAVEGAALTGADLVRLAEAQAVAVDDADRIAGEPVGERALFHLHNLMRDAGGHLLVTGRTVPARWPVALPDLASRLRAAPVVALGSPDETLLAQVLAKHFADRRLAVGPEAIAYLVPRMTRSFAAARRLVAAIDEASLAQGRAVTLPLLRDVLAAQGAPVAEGG
jgi:DnaA regulatory inactivator Hda